MHCTNVVEVTFHEFDVEGHEVRSGMIPVLLLQHFEVHVVFNLRWWLHTERAGRCRDGHTQRIDDVSTCVWRPHAWSCWCKGVLNGVSYMLECVP